MSVGLNSLGREVLDWKIEQFGPTTNEKILVNLMEETGEVARAIGKKAEGIRPASRGNLGEELADATMQLAAIAALNGIDLEDELLVRVVRLKQVDYRKNPEAGQPLKALGPMSDKTISRLSDASGHPLERHERGAKCLRCFAIVVEDEKGPDIWFAESGRITSQPPNCGP